MALAVPRSRRLYNEHAERLLSRTDYSHEELEALLAEVQAEFAAAAPTDVHFLWALVGLIEERFGHFPEALDAHLKAYELNPTHPASPIAVGSVLGILRRHREAMPYLLEAEHLVAKGTWSHLISLCNLVVAEHVLGDRQGARRRLSQAKRVARKHSPRGHMEIAYATCFVDDDSEVLEAVARFVVATEGYDWDDPDPLIVVRQASAEVLNLSMWPAEVRLALERVGVWADESQPAAEAPTSLALPPAPTADELARARAVALDEDGFVDPFALALALAVPSLGVGSSDDHVFRFAHDRPMKRLASADG